MRSPKESVNIFVLHVVFVGGLRSGLQVLFLWYFGHLASYRSNLGDLGGLQERKMKLTLRVVNDDELKRILWLQDGTVELGEEGTKVFSPTKKIDASSSGVRSI